MDKSSKDGRNVEQENGLKRIGDALGGSLARLQAGIAERHRKRVEAAARPGETFAQTEARLRADDAAKEQAAAREKERAQAAAIAAGRQREKDEATAKAAPSSMRKPPNADAQPDFFVPAHYDVSTKDSRSIMDVAPFRLSKKQTRAGEVIRYDLSDGYVEVKAGPDGMASIWDYDLILMMVSHMTEAMNRYRDGRGSKPSQIYRPHVSEILKFCRRGDGGKQADEVVNALDRLKGTTIKSVRERPSTKDGRIMREVEAEGLISRYKVLSYTDSGKVASVEIEAPNWLYKEVTDGKRPDVLTVHPDYFLIDPGIGRFVYRLARKAAGKGIARWAFKTVYEHSGSAGTFKEFSRILRKIIQANDLPEYALQQQAGQAGELLVMQHRDYINDQLPPPEDGDYASV